jgi:predicted HicB family RNase H-like nuclease
MSDKTLSYKGYCGSIEVSAEDDCVHGKLLFVNDLVTYEAATRAALTQAFRDAVDFYIQKCGREGLAVEKPSVGCKE